MSRGEPVDRRIGPHGLDVVTVDAGPLQTPQVTFVAGVADTADAVEIARRMGDLDHFVNHEVRRSHRDDRRT